jgi:hypothetical protein
MRMRYGMDDILEMGDKTREKKREEEKKFVPTCKEEEESLFEY